MVEPRNGFIARRARGKPWARKQNSRSTFVYDDLLATQIPPAFSWGWRQDGRVTSAFQEVQSRLRVTLLVQCVWTYIGSSVHGPTLESQAERGHTGQVPSQ